MLRALVVSTLITHVITCSFPSDLTGEWQSLRYGTLTFTSTSFSGFTSGLHSTVLTFDCYLNSGQQHVVNSSYELFVGNPIDVYLCMNIEQISPVKFFYRLDSNLDDTTNVRHYNPTTTGGTVTLEEACSFTDTRSPGEYDLLIRQGNLTDALSSCPSELASLFDVIDLSAISSCDNDTIVATMDGRTNGLLDFNYSSCVSSLVFNSNGQINCLHYFYEDYGYLTTYNNETVDNSKTFTFTCYVFSKSTATLQATEYPTVCQQNQTPTSVISPGINYTMTDLLYVTPPEDNTLVIALAVTFSLLGAAIIIVVVIVLYLKVFKKKPEPPPEPKVRKKKKKLPVTEYSPRITARSNSLEEKDGLKTHSEIVTKLLTERSAIRYDSFEEPKKEKWQEKWERNLRPETPSTTNKPMFSKANLPSLSGLNLMGFSSNNIDQSLQLPMPTPLSARRQTKHRSDSNLPTAMHSQQPDSQHRLDVKSPLRAESFNLSSKVLEKLRISPRVFQSTGKYQFETMSNQDLATPKTVDSKLEAIKENPLSRPNSVAKEELPVSKSFKRSAEELNRLQMSLRERGSIVSNDRATVTTRSTASARGVFIDDWGTLSNISDNKSAQVNVFDDPGWLSKNDVNEADDVFKRGTSFWSSLPKGKDKDQKWFTGGAKKTEKTKTGDQSYLKTRTKIITTGLNSMDKDGYVRPKKKRDWKFIWEKLKRPKYTSFSFFRRSRHRQIIPSRITTPRCTRRVSDIEKHFLISDLTKDNSGVSLMSQGSDIQHSGVSTSGIQSDIDHTDLLGDNRAYSTVSEPARILRSRTADSLDTGSDITLDEVCDSVSIYSEVFLPTDWLFEDEEYLEKCWRTGSRLQMVKVKNKVKAWLANDTNVFPLK